MRLKDKVAIVTGAAQGIGYAVAHAMAREGASVVAADINSEGADKVAEEINKSGGRAIAVKVDISKEREVEEMVKKTVEEFGKVDILASVAAFTATVFKPFQDNKPEEDWEPHIDVTLRGSLFCAKAVIPHMINQGGGRIITTYVNTINKMAHATDTKSVVSGTLGTARRNAAGCTDDPVTESLGYFIGGYNGVVLTNVDKFDLTTETCSVSSAALATAAHSANSFESQTHGYTTGGNYSTIQEKLAYASETMSVGTAMATGYGASGGAGSVNA